MDRNNQLTLFQATHNNHEIEYTDLPEYNNVNEAEAKITLTFKFRNEEDYLDFKEQVKNKIYNGDKFIDGNQGIEEKQSWFPLNKKESHHIVLDEKKLNPRFPVYIVSKGRWKRNPTVDSLKMMNVPFYIVIEEDEYYKYLKLTSKDNLLILPKAYKDNYDTFWKDNDPRTGPGPARNFAWEHSIKNGYDWHWVMDDNIEHFNYFNNNIRAFCTTGACFYICEDFVLRYENIAVSGLNYTNFCHRHEGINKRPPLIFNTRIYSCLLIRNDIPYRWRGRYNEDTDLSIRVMKDGWCTVQFSNFLQGKMSTQKMKGGNTDEFYDPEGTKRKSQMLVDMHPDIVTLTDKFNRWHHHVNFKTLKRNKLKRKKSFVSKNKINNYGLKIVNINKHWREYLKNGFD